jgi:aminopeptidase N
MREKAIKRFYDEAGNDELVMNKWFSIMASANHPDVLMCVRNLAEHTEFDWTNPNKIRSLVGSFVQNPHFHKLDGEGYAFLREVILKLDKYNPQMSSRMCKTFATYRNFDNMRQHIIKSELETIKSEPNLSPDLQEIIDLITN